MKSKPRFPVEYLLKRKVSEKVTMVKMNRLEAIPGAEEAMPNSTLCRH
jgi:hypothetical protein